MKKQKLKVLVTGSNGFIGKHLILYLKKKNISVVSYDLSDGEDLLDSVKLKKKMKEIDMVLHLAAYGDVYMAAKDPVGAAIVGVAGTANVVQIGNECKVKKIIYASTWEVYGEPQYEPIDEVHPCMPDHPYSISKYGGELMIRSKANKVPWIILRLGSAYGFGMRPHAVIPLFIRKALNKETIILQGGGNQVRQFTHTQDINSAFYRSVILPVRNEIFNIVAKEVISIKQIAFLITQVLPTTILVGKRREADVPPSIVSSEKATHQLKWKTTMSIKRELGKMIKALQETK